MNFFLIIGLVIAGIFLGIGITGAFQSNSQSHPLIDKITNPYSIPSSENEIILRCQNKTDIKEISECLVLNIKTFYKYTRTDGQNHDFNYIKSNGGDCQDYSFLYQEMANKIFILQGRDTFKFNADVQIFNLNNGLGERHEIAIVRGDGKYCILDQEDYWCPWIK